MKQAVSQQTNRLNLRYIAELLNATDIRWFVFFGTLLGLTRDNDVIPGDDDIDIYIDSRDRGKLVKLLEQQGMEFDTTIKPNHTQYFLQTQRRVESEIGLIDFYFFDSQKIQGILIDKWNFLQKHARESKAIHVPAALALPVRQKQYWKTAINIPQMPKELCKWLYGVDWTKPLNKATEYEMTIFNNQPKLVRRLSLKFERCVPKPLRGVVRRLYTRVSECGPSK